MHLRFLTAIAGAVALSAIAAAPAFAADTTVDGTRKGDLVITKLTTPRHDAGDGTEWTPPVGNDPLSNVGFTAQRFSGIDLTTNLGWQAAGAMTVADAQTEPLDPEVTKTTGVDGVAKFDDLPLGLYLITETTTPAGYVKSAPFLVTLPMTDPADKSKWLQNPDAGGDALDYIVYAYPKNDEVTLTKSVNDADDYKAGDQVVWTISAEVPDASSVIDSYQIRDLLDPRLDYVSATATGGTITATDGISATLPGDQLVFHIDPTSVTAGGHVVITLTTSVVDGSAGIIANVADLMVNGSDWDTSSVPSNEVRTIWANLDLVKKAQDDTLLAGAEFDLGYLDAGNWVVIGHEVTDGDGLATFNTIRVEDFENGAEDATPREYFLMETKAPAGYELLAERIAVDLNYGDQDDTGVTIHQGDIINVKAVQLPLTGGLGAAALVLAPLVAAGGGFATILVLRRRRLAAQA